MQPPRRIGVVANLSKPQAGEVAGQAIRRLEQLKIEPVLEEALADSLGKTGHPLREVLDHCDLALVFGGDGTLLSVAREDCARPVPLLGVKVGNFGFLATASVSELPEVLEQVARGQYTTSRRTALECQICDPAGESVKETPAVNDVYISRPLPGRLLTLEMTINGVSSLNYRTDGLIVSTPSGSTGHSLSAGGPVVVPDLGAIVVTPLCPHTLAARPLVLRNDDQICFRVIEPAEETVLAIVDGQANLELGPGGSLCLRGDRYEFVIIKSPYRTYFDVLRSKYHLGARESGG